MAPQVPVRYGTSGAHKMWHLWCPEKEMEI